MLETGMRRLNENRRDRADHDDHERGGDSTPEVHAP